MATSELGASRLSKMTLIDQFLPTYDVVERHEKWVLADRDTVYRAVKELDILKSRPVALLFALRGLPHLVTGKVRPTTRLTMDRLTELGFVDLAEEPGTEIVLGAIGKFWVPTSGIREVDADEFASFEEPGFAKAAMNFHVHEENGETLVITETRVLCTNARARRSFKAYWLIVGPFSSFIRRQMLDLIVNDVENVSPPTRRSPGDSVRPHHS